MGFTIDDRDKAILREMRADASITNASLAKKIGLSASACLARTDNLIKTGVIKQFTAIVDEHKLGIEMFAYALINLVSMKPESIAAFMEYVNGCPQIQECYTITGSNDYLLKIVSTSNYAYEAFTLSLAANPVVASVETLVVLGVKKWTTAFPVDLADSKKDPADAKKEGK